MASPLDQEDRRHVDPRTELDLGEVDGDRPRILNEAIVGSDYGSGEPTMYIGRKTEGWLNRHKKRPFNMDSDSDSDVEDVVPVKRVKTKYGYYTLSANGFILINANADNEVKDDLTARTSIIVHDDISTQSCKSLASIISLRRNNSMTTTLAFIGSWAASALTTLDRPDDEGYQSDPSQLYIDEDEDDE